MNASFAGGVIRETDYFDSADRDQGLAWLVIIAPTHPVCTIYRNFGVSVPETSGYYCALEAPQCRRLLFAQDYLCYPSVEQRSGPFPVEAFKYIAIQAKMSGSSAVI